MPRKSELIQLDLQREFSATMTRLRDIWDEIGMPDEQIEVRGNTVRLHIRNLLAGMVNEETQLKKTMLESIDRYNTEISELTEQLSLPDFQLSDDDMTVMQREKCLRLQLNKLKQEKRQRNQDLRDLQSVEQTLCDQLCSIPYYIPTNSIPSEQQLTELRHHIQSLKEEKQRRRDLFRSKKSEIVCLYDELELIPESSFAQDLVNEMEDSFSLTTSNMTELSTLHKDLTKKRNERRLIMEGLWSQVHFLWERLDVEENERNKVKESYKGVRPNDIEGLRKELSHLEELKLASLQKLTERCRSEITALWDKCFYSRDQRHEFSPAYDENYTEELLNEHEEELARMHAYYEEHKLLFTNVGKWQQLFHRMLELEAKASDVNRYANRGGNLLQEEKERKRIFKQLPKIEQELFDDIDKWEAENSAKKFLVEGTEFRDYVHSQWKAFGLRKENEKLQRHERKRQETESEMAYGSTPKTPTKRRFIGTSTILKTPTDNSKKPKRALDNTCRSVLTSNRMNINRTATMTSSPGKPPISRGCSSITPKRKQLLQKKNHLIGHDTESVKSAPSQISRKGSSLSTTVVSSCTASSANSAPLLENDPSHYKDFVNEINSQARQNSAVRSSAVHDLKRW